MKTVNNLNDFSWKTFYLGPKQKTPQEEGFKGSPPGLEPGTK